MRFSHIASVLVCATFVSLSTVNCTSTSSTPHKHKKSASETQKSEDRNEYAQSRTEGAQLHTIYFDFDRYNIREDQRGNAGAITKSLKKNPDVKVQIQGHTDDRGSTEYNLALGTKRAEALRNYLVTSGVNPDNVDVTSYGKERPAVHGDGEETWARNRRDEVVLLGE